MIFGLYHAFYHQHFFSWHFEMNKILTLQFLSIVWNTLVSSVEWHLFDLWVQANAVQEISLRVRPWFLVLSRKFFSVIAPDFTQCNFCFLQLSLWFSLNIFGIFEFFFKVEKISKIAWILSHHLYFQWKFKLWTGKFP